MEALITRHDGGELGFIRYTILVTYGDQSWSIIRRFNDFQPLHEALARGFRGFRGSLPPKKWFGRFNPEFLKERKTQLQTYLDAVTALPGLLDCPAARKFFEIDRHMGEEGGAGRSVLDGSATDDRGPYEQARITAILEDTSRAFINTSLPLYQVSIEQMDPAELAQQRAKILQRTSGFRGHASVVQKLACSNGVLHPPSSGAGGSQHHHQQQHQHQGAGNGGPIDVLAAPARMTLGLQAQVLEKQGLRIADELREARQIRTRDDSDLICHLREERAM